MGRGLGVLQFLEFSEPCKFPLLGPSVFCLFPESLRPFTLLQEGVFQLGGNSNTRTVLQEEKEVKGMSGEVVRSGGYWQMR